MMKLTVIGPTHPYKGGISHFTTTLVKHLRKAHHVDFLSWKRQYPAFLYPVELKDTQSKNPIKEDASFFLDFFNPFTWIKAALTVKKNKSDLLILTWVSPVQAPIYWAIGLFTKFLSKTKVVYICHNVLPHEYAFYDKPLAKLAFKNADSFIVHSSDDKKVLETLVTNKKIAVGFLPVFDMYENNITYDKNKVKKELNLKKKVLLFFGYIRPYKGLQYLIKAMPEIIKRNPDTSLLIVGDYWSKDKQSYIDLIKNLHLEKNIVSINRYVPNEEIGKYFSVADVVVLPYISATQSASIQTAYAFNKPVIATAVGGLKDVIYEGKTGYFVKRKNAYDLAEKVEHFYKRHKSIDISRNILDKFSWINYTKLLTKI